LNKQQARLEAHLDHLRYNGHRDSRTVDLVNQTRLLAEGYDLRALDDDLND
jgi:hypothetical protein